ncbi:MAG: hypothetical protein HGB12_13790, partial [Bacteroidetes bacterium]|nr:hypothetical protein [Bacteroidota bacterium]
MAKKNLFIIVRSITYVLLTFYFSLFTFNLFSQGIAINATGGEANNSAMLDVSGPSQGVLINRMTTTERNAITTPIPESLLIFNTTTKCLEFYVNGDWQAISCGCTNAPTAVTAFASLTSPCENSTIMLTGIASGATSWSWTGPNGFASTLQSPAISNITTAGAGVYSLTASNICGTATAVNTATVTVNSNLTVSIGIAATATTICTGTSVTFTATPTNGGTSPSYQWKLNNTDIGTNSPTYTTTSLANSDKVKCVITSNATCATGSPATSNEITMTVNPNLPASVSIAATATTICSGTSVTFTATPTNGGSSPSYQWKLNNADVGTNATTYTTTSLANTDKVKCVLTSNATCATGSPATSNEITMTVNPNLTASVSIAASP